ncbi:hypothetical protein [Pseudomonas pergaminensis]|uniref:hypothetical protein n=1 Tax=Pseudomonas pergaminensis TaxID=2853159 RepID=UPI0034D52ADF
MDIETFHNCLSYLSLAQREKSSLELLLPIATTAIGIFIGFGINVIRDRKKDDSAVKNKKMCINEELERTRSELEHIFKECIKIYDSAAAQQAVLGHQIPEEIDTPFLREHFVSIAHRYTKLEREALTQIAPAVKYINHSLHAFMSTYHNPSNTNQIAIGSLNILSCTIHGYQCLEVIDQKEKKSKKTTIIEIANKLSITSAYVDHLRNTPNL